MPFPLTRATLAVTIAFTEEIVPVIRRQFFPDDDIATHLDARRVATRRDEATVGAAVVVNVRSGTEP